MLNELGNQNRRSPSDAAAIIRPGKPRIRTTFQFKGRIAPPLDGSLEDTRMRVAHLCLEWLSAKYSFPLPAEARRLETFFSEEPGQSLRCISIDRPSLWAARLDQPDSPFRGRAAVPGRSWITDVSVAAADGEVLVGLRVQCASLSFADQPIKLTRPRLILSLASAFHFPGQRRILGSPWTVREEELPALKSYLESPQRSGPVFLLTQPDAGRLGLNVRPFLLDADELASRVQGLATVVCMERRVGFEWTALVGKEWSAFHGAVKTYRPGLRFGEDSPYSHSLARAERVLAAEFNGLTAEAAFAAFLEDYAFRQAAEQFVEWAPAHLFPEARGLRAQLALERADEDSDWRTLLEEENGTLMERLRLEKETSTSLREDIAAAKRELEEASAANRRLRAYADSIRSALERKQSQLPEPATILPDNYDDLPDWVEENLPGRLLLHPRAIRALKGATFLSPRLVCDSLLLLAREYRNMRLGVGDGKPAFDQHCAQLGLECGGSIAPERAGAEGDEYFVNYPLGTQKRRFLESHLKKGTSREPSRALRIYFFWDEETSQVVVGWLPSHLDNSLT